MTTNLLKFQPKYASNNLELPVLAQLLQQKLYQILSDGEETTFVKWRHLWDPSSHALVYQRPKSAIKHFFHLIGSWILENPYNGQRASCSIPGLPLESTIFYGQQPLHMAIDHYKWLVNLGHALLQGNNRPIMGIDHYGGQPFLELNNLGS